ncbi:MAG TPA: type III PLP-dependent enzyme [Amycolatopsis sp.]|uniref:type III PLP-dependent enzyme n=1 Tax=Amycolatopsis sp. TaxID=37632 RepID=UPI002B459BA9|nr:type III PLP-dependent enzyme [Amycolatopsis sp.]HKS48592.1 type III PLP-dependent enzyme [Amycolatopsis sp.]
MSHERIHRFLAERRPPTPCLVVDTAVVRERVHELTTAFPGAALRYAVKANPERAVLAAVLAAGGGFDVASPAEIDACLAVGALPKALSYGNPIKKAADVAFAHARGIRDFTTDAESDVDSLARFAPGAAVSVRLLVDGPASATPFGRKFGCTPDQAVELLRRAAATGLDPAGIAFHVGSQQAEASAWEAGIAAAAKVFAELDGHGLRPRRLNIGGGFGVPYRSPVPSLAEYAAAVSAALRSYFPGGSPELLLEPGRAVVATAGLIRTEVVLVAERAGQRWVYLDIGRYNGLAETENEAITYRFGSPQGGLGACPQRGSGGRTPRRQSGLEACPQTESGGPVVIAGPTCDGDDVLYQHTPYELPLSLRAGDQLDILDAGAYTASYSSVAFNGIEPLRIYCLD